MNAVLLFSFLSASLFYLGSRALITAFLWRRYPAKLVPFFDCSACTGFWWGLLLAAIVGRYAHLTYLGLDLTRAYTWPLVGLTSIVATPIAAGLMQRGLDTLGSIQAEEPSSRE